MRKLWRRWSSCLFVGMVVFMLAFVLAVFGGHEKPSIRFSNAFLPI